MQILSAAVLLFLFLWLCNKLPPNSMAKNDQLLCPQILWIRSLDKPQQGWLLSVPQCLKLENSKAGNWNHLKAHSLWQLLLAIGWEDSLPFHMGLSLWSLQIDCLSFLMWAIWVCWSMHSKKREPGWSCILSLTYPWKSHNIISFLLCWSE